MKVKSKGRPTGAQNRPRRAFSVAEAITILEAKAAQDVATAAALLDSTEGGVRREIAEGKLQAFKMGRLVRIPSVVIRQRLFPQIGA